MSEQEAQDPATSPERLEELSHHPVWHILVASNPAAPVKRLETLATDPDVQVRAAVASNPNTPWPILEELAWEFPHAFLHNPMGPLQMVAHPEQISRDEAFWGAILREAEIPSWWWNWLWNHPTTDLSQMLRLHIQEARETTFPDGVPPEGEEIDLLLLVRLLTAAAIQGTALPLQAPNAWGQSPREFLLWLAREADVDVRCIMAQNERMPVEVLLLLAHDHDAQVRAWMAGNEQMPVEVLVALAADEERNVRKAVAANVLAPVDGWAYQVSDADVALRREMAEKALTLLQVFTVLVAREEEIVREAGLEAVLDAREEGKMWREAMAELAVEERDLLEKKAEQAELSASQREKFAEEALSLAQVLVVLATGKEEQVRTVVAESARMLVAVLATLGRDASKYVRRIVAQNPLTPVELLVTLAQDSSVRVRSDAARNKQTPVEVLITLAHDEEWWVRQAVAENERTPVEVLATLAQEQDEFIQIGLAGNRKTPAGVLAALAHNEDKNVRRIVAGNEQTPVEALVALAHDDDQGVRQAVAENERAPVEALIALAHDEEWWVRQAVALNEQTPVEALRALIHNEERWGRECIALKPWAPENVLRLLAQDQEEDVRRDIARNRQTPVEVLVTLAQDQDSQVRSRVAWNLRTPMAVLVALAQDQEARVRWWATLSQRLRAQSEMPLGDEPWGKHADEGVVQASDASHMTAQLAAVARLPVSNRMRQTVMDALAGEWNTAMLRSTFDVEEEVDGESLTYLIAPFQSPLALRQLVASPSWQVRYLVAIHEKTPWEARCLLSQDGNRYVRAMARAKTEMVGGPTPHVRRNDLPAASCSSPLHG